MPVSAGPRGLVWTGRRRVLLGAVVGMVVAGLLTLLRDAPLIETPELQLIDMRTRAYVGTRAPDPRIAIVLIEEADVEWLKENKAHLWPWSLRYSANLARVAEEAGARGFIADVLNLDRGTGLDELPDPSRLTGIQQAELAEEAYEAESYGKRLAGFAHSAIAYELIDGATYEYPKRVAASRGKLGGDEHVDAPALALPQANLPILALTERVPRLGFANVVRDADGVVRRTPFVGQYGDRTVDSLATAVWRSLMPDASGPPQMDDATFLLNFRGPADSTYPIYTARQVLSWYESVRKKEVPEAAKQAFADRIVFLGVSISGAPDVISTPLSKLHLGVEYQATALDNMLHGDGRLRVPRWVNALVLLVLLALAGVWMGARRNPLVALLGPVVLGALLFGAAFPIFRAGWSIDLFTPLLGLLLCAVGTTTLWRFTEGRYNRWLEGTFGRYLAPSIIETLKQDPSRLQLGGHRRELSILFSDVAGFTRISEHLKPAELVGLLNRYLTMHCAAVMDEQGVVDKFEGDAVMAFFGDPLDMPDHAVRACRACLRVQEDLPRLEPHLKALGIERFHVRIGINSGEAVVGNMGSSHRFDYTCMGDNVNLASRLEGANKAFGTRILLGEQTHALAKEHIYAKPLGGLLVVGKTKPVQVYELVGMRDTPNPVLEEHVAAFEEAMDAAKRGDTKAAEVALARAEAGNPGDPACWWLRSVLRDNPRGWDGTTALTSK